MARFDMSLAQIGLAPTWFFAKKLMEVAGPVWAREILRPGDSFERVRSHRAESYRQLGRKHAAQPARDEERDDAPDCLAPHAEQNTLLGTVHHFADAKKGIRVRLKRTTDFKGE